MWGSECCICLWFGESHVTFSSNNDEMTRAEQEFTGTNTNKKDT
jgi:hypothetical protein